MSDDATNLGSGGSAPAPAPTAAEDAAWLLEYANDMDVIGRPVEDRLRAIASRLVALAERLAAAERDGDERVRQVQNAGNGLYLAMLKVLTPAFPEGSRDLDWDVLPGAVQQVLKRAESAEAALATRTAEGEALRTIVTEYVAYMDANRPRVRAANVTEHDCLYAALKAALAPKADGEAGK